MVMPAFDARVASQVWACLLVGGLLLMGAATTLMMNPSWGIELDGRVLRFWHDPRRVRRAVPVESVSLVRVHQAADVAELESTEGTMRVPRECLREPAASWAAALHAEFPHIELRVE